MLPKHHGAGSIRTLSARNVCCKAMRTMPNSLVPTRTKLCTYTRTRVPVCRYAGMVALLRCFITQTHGNPWLLGTGTRVPVCRAMTWYGLDGKLHVACSLALWTGWHAYIPVLVPVRPKRTSIFHYHFRNTGNGVLVVWLADAPGFKAFRTGF